MHIVIIKQVTDKPTARRNSRSLLRLNKFAILRFFTASNSVARKVIMIYLKTKCCDLIQWFKYFVSQYQSLQWC